MSQNLQSLGFSAIKETYIGEKLAEIYKHTSADYLNWFQKSKSSVSALESRDMLKQFMPELLGTYDALCLKFGGDELTSRFLSLYNPPSFKSGCSQAFLTKGDIELVRNYDFPAKLCDKLMLHSNYNGTQVIAMTDCLWGVIDGMNEHGLAVSLAYGGRNKKGNGFGVTLVIRYILEFCNTTKQALEKLKTIPIHMSYNITLIDASGVGKTVLICPGEEIEVTDIPFATNHQQGGTIGEIDAIADSYVREQFLSVRLSKTRVFTQPLTYLFLEPPLLRLASDWNGWGTLYTARYLPLKKSVFLHWPQSQILSQTFDNFIETHVTVYSRAFGNQ